MFKTGWLASALDLFNNRWRAMALVGALTAISAISGVFSMPVLDRDEARYAQATAQMLETGDWVDIRFMDEVRYKKPVGIYWIQAVTVSTLSSPEARAIWAYRLPSVLGAILAAIATLLAGRALLGYRAGLAAGVLMSSVLVFGVEGGIAKTDAMLTAMSALAFLALIKVRKLADQPSTSPWHGRLWATLGWVAVAIGAIIKGPIAPLTMGLAVLALSAVERRIDWWKAWIFPLGPVLAAAIVLPWFMAIQSASGGAFLNEALGEDLGPKLISGHEGHGAPFGSHMALLPLLFFPAVMFLPAGAAAAYRAIKRQDETRVRALLILTFALPIWLVFEIMPTKLPHYTLPVYPALAVLSTWGFITWIHTSLVFRVIGVLFMLIGGTLGAGLIAGLDTAFSTISFSAGGWPLIVLILTIAACIAGIARMATAALVFAVLAGLSWQVGARAVVLPGLDNLQLSERLSRSIDTSGLKTSTIPLVSTYTEPSFVFLRRGDLSHITLDEAEILLDDGQGPRLVVYDTGRMKTEFGRAYAEDFRLEIDELGCEYIQVDGFNYSRGETTSLVAVRTDSCAGPEATQ